MYDFFSGQHDQLVYLADQLVDVHLFNDLVSILSRDVITVVQTSNVLACNSNNHIFDFLTRNTFGLFYSLLDGLDRLSDVVDNPSFHTHTFGFSDS